MPGPREGYADASLSSADDWVKHAYTYRLFGRLTYAPEADPESWRRSLRGAFGPAAGAAEAALASASHILPLVTTAHHPSASNNYYWPEVYTDIGIVGQDGSVETHYYDTPVPKRFGTVGPLDPEIFVGVEEFVREVRAGRRSGRCSPLEVAEWLERLSDDAREHLARAEKELPDPTPAEARRLILDVAIQEALGRFFAGKLRAAFLYEVFASTGDPSVLREGLEIYRAARAAWAEAADRGSDAYVDDLTYGPQPWLRGTWSDRLPAIDRDIDAMAAVDRTSLARTDTAEADARRLLTETSLGSLTAAVSHTPPPPFRPGEPVRLVLAVGDDGTGTVETVRLRYRHLDQSKAYEEAEMAREGERFVGEIAGPYSDSPYALQYLFVIRDHRGGAWLHPGLGAELSDQPYCVVRQERSRVG